jgi:D-cysteine desulfhydrase
LASRLQKVAFMTRSIAASWLEHVSGHRPARPGSLMASLERAPEVPLGIWPTPLQRIERLGKCDLLIKRDDLSGHGRGGAKTRKISHLLGHVFAAGHDQLLIVAGNITNLAFDLVPAVDACGLDTRIFILDDPPASPRDREQIFEGIRSRVELLGGECFASARRIGETYLRARRRGGRPFLALPGVSHPASVIGSARGFLEMARQLDELGEPLPATVFVTAATGTTVAGFLLAAHALRCEGRDPIQVVGVQVYPGNLWLRTLALVRWTERALGLRASVPVHRTAFVRQASLGFGAFGAEVPDLCERVKGDLGLALDPIFGGKTWQAMEADRGASAAGARPLLYWHCGYTPEWRKLCQAVGRTPRRIS